MGNDTELLQEIVRKPLDGIQVRMIIDDIVANDKVGTYFVEKLGFKGLSVIANRLAVPIFYVYPISNDRVGIEIKNCRSNFSTEKKLEQHLAKISGVDINLKWFDAVGDSSRFFPALFSENSELKKEYPIIIEKQVFGMNVADERGKNLKIGGKDVAIGDLKITLPNGNEISYEMLDDMLGTDIAQRLNAVFMANEVKNSNFSFTDDKVFFRGYDSRMHPRAAKLAVHFMRNYNNQNSPINTGELVKVMQQNGAVGATPNEAYTAIKEINDSLSQLVEKRNLKFVKKMGYGVGYIFNSNGF